MDFTAGLMPLDTALAQMLDRITPLNATETVPLLQAFSRVTAHDIVSPLDVPGFDNAAMDGYAVRLNDLRDGAALPVAGKAFAGQPFNDAWPTGTCIRIMTGAPVPAGCDAVVMQEETEQTEAGVRFIAPVKAGQHIRRRGEDIAHGAVVFPAGTPLTVAELPVLASLGIAEVEVVRKVRVAVFSTGDELQLPGQPLGDGQIYDTNRLAVHLMLQQLGYEVINLGIIPDDPAKLRDAFIDADQQAALLCQLDDELTLAYRGSEGLFRQYMLAVAQGGENGFGVIRVRCRHRDHVDSFLFQQCFQPGIADYAV